MRFLLVAVNSKYIHSNPAVYSLRAYAKAAGLPKGCRVELAEYTINEQVEHILQQIYMAQPDVIGFSCYIWNISYIRQLAADLHQVLPHVPIWLGGPEASYQGSSLLEELDCVTGIMVGEGEETFSMLLSHYCDGRPLEEIPGLVYRKDGCVYDTGAPLPFSFSKVPFLYSGLEAFANRIIYYESSRGCPYRCSYCLSSIDKRVRFRPMEQVKQELAFFLAKRVPQVKFIDRTFNADSKRSLEIWQFLTKQDNGVTNFHFEISADLLTEAEFAVMEQMRPGLIQLEIGVQSTNLETLQAIRRHASFEKIEAAVNRIRQMHRIHQHLDLIAGLPFEDYERFGRSFDQVYRLHPDQLQLGFLKVLKGSHLYETASSYGIVWSKRPPYEVLETKWLSYAELIRLKAIEEVVETYYNSGQFKTSIAYLEGLYERPFVLYEKLAAFCSQGEAHRMAHNRMQQYERLLAFVTADAPAQLEQDVWKSALVHDCYLRENCKSRPSFAEEAGLVDKDAARRFYQQEALQHRYPLGDGYTSKQLANLTHLEQYPVDVLQLQEGRICRRKTVVCYAYQNREPFHHDGMVWDVTNVIGQQCEVPKKGT